MCVCPQAREADLERARNQLPPEPAHGGKTAESVPTTVLRFTLPSGTRVQRRFKCDDTIDVRRRPTAVVTATQASA